MTSPPRRRKLYWFNNRSNPPQTRAKRLRTAVWDQGSRMMQAIISGCIFLFIMIGSLCALMDSRR